MNHLRATRIDLHGPPWGGLIVPRRGTQRSDSPILPCTKHQSDSRSSQELTSALRATDEGQGELKSLTGLVVVAATRDGGGDG